MAFWWKLLGIVAEKHFTFEDVEFDENRFFVTFLPWTVHNEQKSFGRLVKSCSRVFKAASYMSRGTMNWVKHFYSIVFTIFEYWAKTIGPFAGIFSAGLSKLQSKFQGDESHEIRFLSLFSQELLILSKKLSNFSWKNFTGVFEAASYVSRGAMTWGKHFVLELFLLSLDIRIKIFSLLVETSRHCCRKTVYVSRSWVWRKPFFLTFLSWNVHIEEKSFGFFG